MTQIVKKSYLNDLRAKLPEFSFKEKRDSHGVPVIVGINDSCKIKLTEIFYTFHGSVSLFKISLKRIILEGDRRVTYKMSTMSNTVDGIPEAVNYLLKKWNAIENVI